MLLALVRGLIIQPKTSARKIWRFSILDLSESYRDLMLLGNMMDDKQLNFSRPLLSVRRHSSTPVVEKDTKRNSRRSLPGVPRPPQYKSELKSGPMRNPGTVPFQWEQSPGRPKDERTAETHVKGPRVAPKLPPGRSLIANKQDTGNVSTNAVASRSQDRCGNGSQDASHFDEYGRGVDCQVGEREKPEEEKADSDDEDEVYEDALDTLSRAESSFLNCSMSGVSGLDDTDVKPSGTNFNDPEAKEFMIGRFLPAAKAMITETPQYAPPKKQPSTVEDYPRQMKKVVKGDKVPQLRYGPSFAKHYFESQYTPEEESDDENEEYENFSAKACGLLPKFCLKSSLCLLNPLPAMSVRTRAMTPARRVPAGSSSASSCSKTENEHSSFDDSEQRSIDGSLTTEILDDKNNVSNKSNEVSSTYGHGGLSGNHNESSHSSERIDLPAISSSEKGYKSFRELLADESTDEEVASGGPAVEKTVYVDIDHKGKTRDQKTGTSTSEGLAAFRRDIDEVPTKMVEAALSEDPLPVKSFSNGAGRGVLKTNLPQATEKNGPKAFREDEQHLYQDAAGSANVQVPVEKTVPILRKETPKVGRHENFHGINAEFPLPPPLPNSPSDSWLCRTLPSMSLKNPSSHSHFGTGACLKDQASKTQSGDPKWETIVKATKVHLQHLRYPEELLAAIPEN